MDNETIVNQEAKEGGGVTSHGEVDTSNIKSQSIYEDRRVIENTDSEKKQQDNRNEETSSRLTNVTSNKSSDLIFKISIVLLILSLIGLGLYVFLR